MAKPDVGKFGAASIIIQGLGKVNKGNKSLKALALGWLTRRYGLQRCLSDMRGIITPQHREQLSIIQVGDKARNGVLIGPSIQYFRAHVILLLDLPLKGYCMSSNH
jgi:hypothetical protein